MTRTITRQQKKDVVQIILKEMLGYDPDNKDDKQFFSLVKQNHITEPSDLLGLDKELMADIRVDGNPASVKVRLVIKQLCAFDQY